VGPSATGRFEVGYVSEDGAEHRVRLDEAWLVPLEWALLKRSLANLAKHDIGQLTALVKTQLRRMQYRPGLLDGFLAKTGLDLGNPHH